MTQRVTPRVVWRVYKKLVKLYGEPRLSRRARRDALEQLVATILSQNTTDVNTARAFEKLTTEFPTWEAMRDAPTRAIIRAVRSAGLANTKAPRIQAILRQLTRERGELSLDFLRRMPLQDAREYLQGLKGVGPKTAAIVLLFTFGRPAFPVDTHIWRVTKRLGWIPEKASREQAHVLLEALVPSELDYPLHLNLIAHGRRICKAGRPRCEVCPLKRECEYYEEQMR